MTEAQIRILELIKEREGWPETDTKSILLKEVRRLHDLLKRRR